MTPRPAPWSRGGDERRYCSDVRRRALDEATSRVGWSRAVASRRRSAGSRRSLVGGRGRRRSRGVSSALGSRCGRGPPLALTRASARAMEAASSEIDRLQATARAHWKRENAGGEGSIAACAAGATGARYKCRRVSISEARQVVTRHRTCDAT